LTLFEIKKMKKDEKINLKKMKNWKKIKAKEKKYFREVCIKKVSPKMDQQQNGKCRKGPQQNGPRQKDVLP